MSLLQAGSPNLLNPFLESLLHLSFKSCRHKQSVEGEYRVLNYPRIAIDRIGTFYSELLTPRTIPDTAEPRTPSIDVGCILS